MGLSNQGPRERIYGWDQEEPITWARLWQPLSVLQEGQSTLAGKLGSILVSALGECAGEGAATFPTLASHIGYLPYLILSSSPNRANIITIPVQK